MEFEGVETTETFLWDQFCGHFQEDGFSVIQDSTLENGSEIATPILTDSAKDWRKLNEVCQFAQNIGGITTKNCGTHIHFGADIFEKNPQFFRMFLEL